MSVEIECKLKVESHSAVRQTLENLGASRLGMHLETNLLFDNKEGQLREQDAALRLRSSRSLDSESSAYTFTFKGARDQAGVKKRPEWEVEVSDAETVRHILESLGYQPSLCFEKRRESWSVDDCEVDLDELPHLGCYIEIEGPSEESIEKVQAKLGVSDVPHIPQTYMALLVAYCRRLELPSDEIVFPA